MKDWLMERLYIAGCVIARWLGITPETE